METRMEVVIDGRSLGSALGGDETMLRGLLRGLAASALPADGFVILGGTPARIPAEVLQSPAFRHVALNRRPGPVHFASELPKALRRMHPRPEAVLSVTHAPIGSSVPSALVVNDISFLRAPDLYPRATQMRLRLMVGWQIRRCAVVITVSEFCRRDILDAYDLDESRVITVPNSIDPPRTLTEGQRADAALWLQERGVDRPFILYLGNLHPRKNVPRLIRSFSRAQGAGALAGHQLVLGGGSWWRSHEEEEALERVQPGAVIRLGRVDDLMREHLLQSADALAYLAVFEGFGLPPLEAMARGTPVLAAASGAIPEVVGQGALLVDPGDDDDVEQALIRLVTDSSLRQALTARGYEQAAQYGSARTGPPARVALTLAARAA
jgi:glycosyltransferase involved in cell wall biosynthesis